MGRMFWGSSGIIIYFFSSYSVEVCVIIPSSCLDGTVLSGIMSFVLPQVVPVCPHLEHWCMRVNLFNNGQNCSVRKSARLFNG